MTPLERRIADAVAQAKRDGLEPKCIYLNADDREALGLTVGDQLGGLPIRASAKRSAIYSRHGIARAIAPAKGGRPHARGWRLSRRPPSTATPR